MVEDVVAVAAADAGDDALVAQNGVHPSLAVAGTDELGELVGVGLRPEALERAFVTRLEHPPRRLALGAELLDQHVGATVEPQTDDSALGSGALGLLLDVDPSALGEMDDYPRPTGQIEQEVLAAPADLLDGLAHPRVGRRD